MNGSLRWRMIALQVVLTLVLAVCAAFLFWGSGFITGQVHDQLAAQKISFPAANSAAVTALPAADASALGQYAGQQLTTGPEAAVYANHFIAVHLNEIGGGKTYAQFPATGLTPAQAQVKATLFQGETLRGLLLNAYGWSQVGMYAGWAAIVLAIATAAVFTSLIFELAVGRREEEVPTRARAA